MMQSSQLNAVISDYSVVVGLILYHKVYVHINSTMFVSFIKNTHTHTQSGNYIVI